MPANVMFCLVQYRVRPGEKCEFTTKSTKVRAFCKIPLIRPADPGIIVQRVFVVSKLGAQYQIFRQHNLPCCEFCKRLVTKRILAPAGLFVARQPSRFFSDGGPSRFRNPSRDARCEDIHAGRRPSAGSDHTKPACLGRFSSFRSICVFVPFVAIPGKDPAATFCKRLY